MEYEIYTIDQLTFDEQATLKKLTGGMSLRKLMVGISEMDVDAWRGVILVSVQKQNPRFDPAWLGSLNMVDLVTAINEDDDESEVEAEDSPPPTATPVAEPPIDSTSSSAGAGTPEASGTPTSLGSSI